MYSLRQAYQLERIDWSRSGWTRRETPKRRVVKRSPASMAGGRDRRSVGTEVVFLGHLGRQSRSSIQKAENRGPQLCRRCAVNSATRARSVGPEAPAHQGLSPQAIPAGLQVDGPSTNRARSRRSISNGVMHFTPILIHALGILILLTDCSAFSCVTSVCPCASACATR